MFDRDRIADYQRMVAQLRNADIRAELYLGNPKNNLGQQLKYADRRGCALRRHPGPDEKAKGEVQIKRPDPRRRDCRRIKEREEYLKKQAEAQFAVQEAQTGRRSAQIFARHGL